MSASARDISRRRDLLVRHARKAGFRARTLVAGRLPSKLSGSLFEFACAYVNLGLGCSKETGRSVRFKAGARSMNRSRRVSLAIIFHVFFFCFFTFANGNQLLAVFPRRKYINFKRRNIFGLVYTARVPSHARTVFAFNCRRARARSSNRASNCGPHPSLPSARRDIIANIFVARVRRKLFATDAHVSAGRV